MFSISLASCEVKEKAEAVENLVAKINDLFEGLGGRSCLLLDEAEHYILEGTRSLGQKLLEMYASQ